MKLGAFTITPVLFGLFRLDGGSMFGAVPKTMWSKLTEPDADNCIRLATRSILIEADDRKFLVDVGNGDKWSEKQRAIYGIHNFPESSWGFESSEITDVILTHMHFDHAGGISRRNAAGEIVLSYPQARVHLQIANWENARRPSPRERASYLQENTAPLEQADLVLCDGDVEIHPGISVVRSDGHTRGLQWIKVESEGRTLLFPADLVPTSHHVALPYHMGYDMCTQSLMTEKESFLQFAEKTNAIVVFEHDPIVAAGRIGRNDRGAYAIIETLDFQ